MTKDETQTPEPIVLDGLTVDEKFEELNSWIEYTSRLLWCLIKRNPDASAELSTEEIDECSTNFANVELATTVEGGLFLRAVTLDEVLKRSTENI